MKKQEKKKRNRNTKKWNIRRNSISTSSPFEIWHSHQCHGQNKNFVFLYFCLFINLDWLELNETNKNYSYGVDNEDDIVNEKRKQSN